MILSVIKSFFLNLKISFLPTFPSVSSFIFKEVFCFVFFNIFLFWTPLRYFILISYFFLFLGSLLFDALVSFLLRSFLC